VLSMQNNKAYQYGGIFVILIAVDQFLKFILNKYYPSVIYESQQNIIGLSSYLQLVLLIILIVIIFLLYYKNKGFKENLIAFVFIIAGAISNLIDRFSYHHVIDYIPIINGYFNLSDLFIFFGLVLIILNIRKKTSSC